MHFMRYAPFTKRRNEMYHIAREQFELPPPLPMGIFEMQDANKRCLYHNFNGHFTGDCLQLKNLLEKLAREGKLIEFINSNFYKKHMWKYNGRGRDFKRKIPYRREFEERRPERDERGNAAGESRQPKRPPSPVINVVSKRNAHVVWD